MRSNYKKLGNYIRQVNIKNTDGKVDMLVGVNLEKKFIPSVANIVGTDLTKYKVIKKGQFGCKLMSVGRDGKLPISLMKDYEKAIISSAYYVFEVKNENELLSDYLMMWLSRSENDRYLWFKSGADVRGSISWNDFCSIEINIPSIEKQREIVAEYYAITNRIKLNEQLNQKLEETAQAIYKEWFVDFENGEIISLDSLVEFNPKHSIKKNVVTSYIEMADLQETSMSIKNIIKRPFTNGSKFKNNDTLLARITPCLENGKTAFVKGLSDKEIAFGSTEFIVMRAKKEISPYWVYCLAREENFRAYAISSMIGSSGRQRVHSDYLKDYEVSISINKMSDFHKVAEPLFETIYLKSQENKKLLALKEVLLSKMVTVEG
ncbi:restriction endonuclease subunit S [Francisella opportunistica]|uniref:Restriction endonuclease subunit S n=1 Tax=Francisella opportunistica TaxID=2016517 RepID=A0A345JR90_9GAMM|nr:restriction endonuclease subunit S [Francisella opportunistica]AXH29836.1 restriction endonuclease subunit S [Francisella opportunistica]